MPLKAASSWHLLKLACKRMHRIFGHLFIFSSLASVSNDDNANYVNTVAFLVISNTLEEPNASVLKELDWICKIEPQEEKTTKPKQNKTTSDYFPFPALVDIITRINPVYFTTAAFE